MENNIMRKPLLNSAAVFAFFIGLIAVSLAHPEATVFQAAGMLIQAVFRAVQLLIGLGLAAVFCVAVLISIFLGAVALADRNSAARMYGELRQTLADWLVPVLELAGKKKIEEPVNFEPVKEEMRQELQANIGAIQSQLHATRELLAGKIGQLSSRIDTLEDLTAKMADTAQVETLRGEVRGAMSTLAGIESAVGGMKSCVEQTAQQILRISPEELLGDLPERLRLLEQREPEVIDITPLERDIALMQQELAVVREKADKALLTTTSAAPVAQEAAGQEALPSDEHRLFSYFADPADRQKIVELTDEALEKGLNHKQTIDYLTRGLGAQKGKIISAHPAVFKDYLKTCRRND
ncbi:hypothetical protein [Candidatus Electronema sp. JM]|uniref:hypothetical protein n=1 Tax=Candidatus Electronema sp. JM TaxID=3401571 RepID=UPI003AA7CFB3